MTEAELRELYDLCDQMDSPPPTADLGKRIYRGRQLDARFHNRLVELSRVSALRDLYRRQHLLQLHMFGWNISRLPQHVRFFGNYDGRLGREHRRVVDALASRDPRQAEDALRTAMQEGIRRHREGWKKMRAASPAEGR